MKKVSNPPLIQKNCISIDHITVTHPINGHPLYPSLDFLPAHSHNHSTINQLYYYPYTKVSPDKFRTALFFVRLTTFLHIYIQFSQQPPINPLDYYLYTKVTQDKFRIAFTYVGKPT